MSAPGGNYGAGESATTGDSGAYGDYGASAPLQEACKQCGNIYMDDSSYCRKCGTARPSRVCVCGNVFMDDSVYCRKCGKPRNGGGDPLRNTALGYDFGEDFFNNLPVDLRPGWDVMPADQSDGNGCSVVSTSVTLPTDYNPPAANTTTSSIAPTSPTQGQTSPVGPTPKEKSQLEQKQKDLLEVKAKEMSNMIEFTDEKRGGVQKICFLTNQQATVISDNKDNQIYKLLYDQECFGFKDPNNPNKDPKLFIYFMASWGGIRCVNLYGKEPMEALYPAMDLGPPFETDEEALNAEDKICAFMKEVLIPLAVSTNAIILCGGIKGVCSLACHFNRMVKLELAKWGGTPPFHVIEFCTHFHPLYNNKNKDTFWRYLREQSPNWQRRDAEIDATIFKTEVHADLDESANNFLLVDSVDDEKKIADELPGEALLNQIVSFMRAKIPVLGFKTGMAWKKHAAVSSLVTAVDVMKSGCPVIFLDTRSRPCICGDTRKARLKRAMDSYTDLCDRLMCRTDWCIHTQDEKVSAGPVTRRWKTAMWYQDFEKGAETDFRLLCREKKKEGQGHVLIVDSAGELDVGSAKDGKGDDKLWQFHPTSDDELVLKIRHKKTGKVLHVDDDRLTLGLDTELRNPKNALWRKEMVRPEPEHKGRSYFRLILARDESTVVCNMPMHGVDYVSLMKDAESPHDKLKVKMISARGLRDADWLTGQSDPFCACSLVGKEDKTEVKSGTVNNSSDPQWNHEVFVPEYKPGDKLCFQVFDSDFAGSKDNLGKAILDDTHFCKPRGFQGELPLVGPGTEGKAGAFVTVKVTRPGTRLKQALREAVQEAMSASLRGRVDPDNILVRIAPGPVIQAIITPPADTQTEAVRLWLRSAREMASEVQTAVRNITGIDSVVKVLGSQTTGDVDHITIGDAKVQGTPTPDCFDVDALAHFWQILSKEAKVPDFQYEDDEDHMDIGLKFNGTGAPWPDGKLTILEVSPDSWAAEHDFRPNDVITELNSQPADMLTKDIFEEEMRRRPLSFRLCSDRPPFEADDKQKKGGPEALGLELIGLPPEKVCVRKVQRDSWAAKVCIRQGDEIIEVNGISIFDMTANNFLKEMQVRPLWLKVKDPRPQMGRLVQERAINRTAAQRKRMPIHRAIHFMQKDTLDAEGNREDKRAQVVEATHAIISKFYEDFWTLNPARKTLEEKGHDWVVHYQEAMREWRLHAEALLLDPQKFYCFNAEDISEGRVLVNSLVRSDNLLPNTYVGLVALRTAWDEIDEATYNAERYKAWSKSLFALQLLLQMLTVWCTCMRAQQKVLGWDRRLSLRESLGEPWSEGESCDVSVDRLLDVCPGLLSGEDENASRVTKSLGLLDLEWELSGASNYADPIANRWGLPTVSQAASWLMLPTSTAWQGEHANFLERRVYDSSGNLEEQIRQPRSPRRRLSNLEELASTDTLLTNLIFVLSLTSTLVIAITRYLNPTSRWRHLRSMACHLESTIWRYRTRVAQFLPQKGYARGPDDALRDALAKWRNDLFTGSDLQVTSVAKVYPKKVYTHFQREGEIGKGVAEPGRKMPANGDLNYRDDHQSPSEPEAYVQLRLYKMLKFYQDRLPVYSRYRAYMILISIMCTSISALLAYGQQTLWVAILSSITAAAVSWEQFADLSRKIERYSTAIRGIKAKITWWDSLTEVEKAGTEKIEQFVVECESIITSEFQAWNSLGGKDDEKESGNEKDEDKGGTASSDSGKKGTKTAKSSG